MKESKFAQSLSSSTSVFIEVSARVYVSIIDFLCLKNTIGKVNEMNLKFRNYKKHNTLRLAWSNKIILQ